MSDESRKRRFSLALLVGFLPLVTGWVAGEKLYNGIVLPETWPPRALHFSLEPMPVPYLKNPPDVIPIDLGRQLLVDDFLLEHTTLARTFHQAQYHTASPVLRPDQKWETGVMPFSGGVWHDPSDGLFKVWYQAIRKKAIAHATSRDGIHWEKPDFGVEPGTNIVHRFDHDTATVWLDLQEQDSQRRFKMTLTPYLRHVHRTISGMRLFFSPDGIQWSDSDAGVGWCLDRSTFFFNPFRKVWVYSIKWNLYGIDITRSDGVLRPLEGVAGNPAGRFRGYREHPDLAQGLGWELARDPKTDSDHEFLNNFLSGPVVPWTGADFLDPLRNTGAPSGSISNLNKQPELYNLDAVAYESLMLGLFNIFHGNDDGTPGSHEHMNDVTLGFSRDGFHWHRPDRRAFLPVSQRRGDWNWTNVQSVAGGCLVVGDKLYFYATGRSPDERTTGLATLRRDGFASLDAGSQAGTLVTRPVVFQGRHLFVNLDADAGELRVEILSRGGQRIPPFSRENCLPLRADSTLQAVRWQGAADLSQLAGKPVRFRFHLQRGSLYSFWVSPDPSGASHGYVGAGGPGFTGSTDTVGSKALR